MSMAEASFHDSLTNSISPVRNVKIPIYAPCQGRLFPCMGCWPMLAGKAHTGPQKGGQRGICLPGQYPETVPGSVSARRRHRGQGDVPPASARNVHFCYACDNSPRGGELFSGPAGAVSRQKSSPTQAEWGPIGLVQLATISGSTVTPAFS